LRSGQFEQIGGEAIKAVRADRWSCGSPKARSVTIWAWLMPDAPPKAKAMPGAQGCDADWRRIHTRYDRCAHTFFSAIVITATFILRL
jgi:hypothetical protein